MRGTLHRVQRSPDVLKRDVRYVPNNRHSGRDTKVVLGGCASLRTATLLEVTTVGQCYAKGAVERLSYLLEGFALVASEGERLRDDLFL